MRVTGPLPSLVPRAEDIWQKLETNVIEVAGSQSGFPKKPFSPLMSNRCSVSSMNMLKTIYQRCVVRMRVYAIYFSMRLGDAIDPCHLANGFEAVISYECQERRANPLSRIPRIQTSHARCDMHGVTKEVSGWGGSFPVLWRPMMVPRGD